MEQSEINKLKEILQKQKEKVEQELAQFTEKDPVLKGDYDTRFPDFGTIQSSDENASEVAAYESALPIEYALELRLASINKALEKIEKGTYGICENCNEKIDLRRLEIMPEANACLKCQKK